MKMPFSLKGKRKFLFLRFLNAMQILTNQRAIYFKLSNQKGPASRASITLQADRFLSCRFYFLAFSGLSLLLL